MSTQTSTGQSPTPSTSTTTMSTSSTTKTPTTTPPCSFPPAVANAQSPNYLDPYTVEYSCAPGFRVSGSPRITCRNHQWTGPGPSCVLIDPRHRVDNNIYISGSGVPVWLVGLMAGLMGLIALTCLACCIAHICGCWGINKIHPSGSSGSRSCCRKSRRHRRRSVDSEDSFYANETLVDVQSGPYIIPVTHGTRMNNHHHVKKTVKHVVVSDNVRHPQNMKYPREGYCMNSPSSDMNDNGTGDNQWASKSKEQKIWMPHTHPVRNINTSTK